MSKIYEALLRAEIERVASENAASKAPSESPPKDEFPLAKPERDEPVSLAPSSVAPSPVSRDPFGQLSTYIPSEPAQPVGQDFRNATRSCRWNLSMKQLPSTEEQGSGVEQFRSLRSRIYEFRSLNTLKTLMVSSGLPEEGKSFVAINLAISLARYKASRVLLIDGDMRRGTLHKILGAPSIPGLTEFLSGRASLEQVTQRAQPNDDGTPLAPGIGLLHFISCGGDAENAADLSGSSRFSELIQLASPRYDWIILDSSPVNLIADGINLARSCDGVLLVARGGVTKFQVAQRALQELKASTVVGVVLNAVHKPLTAAGYYGYDAYEAEKG